MKNLLAVFLLISQVLHAQDTTKSNTNLIAEGIPPIPDSIIESMYPYSEFRSASFCDWHPKRQEMIVSTRFGNVPQLHLISMPLGARKQLTFYSDPITNASFEPKKGDYFLFTKDKNGDEFSQIYRYTMQDGKIDLLTDGNRSQNGGITWSKKGKWMAYTSTSRNGTDRDIYVMDPADKATNKLLLQTLGGGWQVVDWSNDEKQLLIREAVSANESHYWLVEVATAKKIAVTPSSEHGVFYGKARFNKNGTGIYFTTDRENEFTRLAYMDISTKAITYLTSSIRWNVENFDVSEDGKRVAFITNEAGESKLYILNTTTPAQQYFLIRTISTGVYGGLTFHQNSKHLAITINSVHFPADVYVISTSNGKIERWTESEMSASVASNLRAAELIKWRSFDNKEIAGFYYKPTAKFTGKRPVIINIHGGPEGQS